jgi:hypothetical protein
MKSYTPNQDALKIAEIHHRTGLNYAECKKVLKEIETIKTPRGILRIQDTFNTVKEAKAAGYGIYFTNDDGKEIMVKHTGEYTCHFAVALKY